MILPHSIRSGVALGCLALATSVAFAGPPVPVRPAPNHVRPYPYSTIYHRPVYSGARVGVGFGIGGGYGSGLYGPLGYGLGYSPFGYSGLPYGGLGYGALGYGFGYPSTYRPLGVPVIPGTYYPTPAPSIPSFELIPTRPVVQPEPLDPQPLPLPLPNKANTKGEPATITVITSEGATVTFDGIETKEAGTRHSFTTKPIAPGEEIRVKVQVNGTGGPSSISVGMRGGEKATVDMRK